MTKVLARIIVTDLLVIRLEFKLQDCWVGIFWQGWVYNAQETWICIIPMFPIHIIRLKYASED